MDQLQRNKHSVAVAMSGGVDSSVTAALMIKKGFTVSGVFMALAQPDLQEQIDRVKKIATFLDIPLDVVTLSTQFKCHVLDYFSQSYLSGKTPNPCVVCNRTIKFGKLLDHCLKSASYMATGHYAQVETDNNGRTKLLEGLDPQKDQSYFLSQLTQKQLSKVIFPLGNTTKQEVYGVAEELGLKGKHSTESQDVCFMQGKSLNDFFDKDNSPQQSGPIITTAGEIKGHHSGIENYTIGQRKGLGVPDKTPYYVTAINAPGNQIIIGKKNDLWRDWLEIDTLKMNWISGMEPNLPQEFLVKIRYRHQGASARVEKKESVVRITFSTPQRAITPGQFAVLYINNEVIGSGEINPL